MKIHVPELSIVAVIGDDFGVQEVFLKRYFNQEEIFYIKEIKLAERRLEIGKLVAIPISSQDENAYMQIIELSKKQHVTPVGIIIYKQMADAESKATLQYEEKIRNKGFKQVYRVNNQDGLENLEVKRTQLSNNKRELNGPFDLIGDVHGCYDELCELLGKLGYKVDIRQHKAYSGTGRIVIFCGDLVDRGPKVVDVLKLVMNMTEEANAYCVLGNHDGKLQRKLHGANVKVIHGLETTLEQLDKEPVAFRNKVRDFLDTLVSHYVFDEGRLVVAHAGLKEHLQGRESKVVRDLAMFGETTGQIDEHGYPVRLDWSKDYRGRALVVYGHTPRAEAKENNYTINIDTGCVFGGKLTAFRYPEQEIVDVKAKAIYYESGKPIV